MWAYRGAAGSTKHRSGPGGVDWQDREMEDEMKGEKWLCMAERTRVETN